MPKDIPLPIVIDRVCLPVDPGPVGAATPPTPLCPRQPCAPVVVDRLCPSLEEVLAKCSLASIGSLLGAANANADEFTWFLAEHLKGPEGFDFYEKTTGGEAHHINDYFVDDVFDGVSSAGKSGDGERGQGRVVGRALTGALVGVFHQAFNAGLGKGGVAEGGVAGPKGEVQAAQLGKKYWWWWQKELWPKCPDFEVCAGRVPLPYIGTDFVVAGRRGRPELIVTPHGGVVDFGLGGVVKSCKKGAADGGFVGSTSV